MLQEEICKFVVQINPVQFNAMQIIRTASPLVKIWEEREHDYTEMMKIVVDVDNEILAIDGDMHADLEKLLLESGSMQQSLWGANVYPDGTDNDFIEYTSFINIRPSQGNRSMEVLDNELRTKILNIVKKLLI